MSAPTIYFPDVPFKLGFRFGRQHSTTVSGPGPSGRRQASINWPKPKRRMVATLLGVDGSQTPSAVTFQTIREFLDLLHGRYRSFYIFDPRAANYGATAPEAFVGLFNTTFPMVAPFKGGTITGVYDDGVLAYAPGNFVQDSGGTGGEKRIVSVTGALPADGSLIAVSITGAKQRIPAVMLNDYDDFGYDFTAAEPPVEYSLDMEEDFG